MILLLLLLLAVPVSAQISSGGGPVVMGTLEGAPSVSPTFWHKMPNGSGTTVTAFLGDSGITSNGTAWVAHGTNNFGLDFDANDDLANFGTNYDGLSAAPFSVSAWVAADSYGESSTGRIVGKGSGANTSWTMSISGAASVNRLQMKCATNTSNAGDLFVSDTGSFDPYIGTALVHVGAWCNCNVMDCSAQLYINGLPVNTTLNTDTTTGTQVDDSAYTLNIGSLQNGGNTFEGDIDDVRVIPAQMTDANFFWIFKGGPQ